MLKANTFLTVLVLIFHSAYSPAPSSDANVVLEFESLSPSRQSEIMKGFFLRLDLMDELGVAKDVQHHILDISRSYFTIQSSKSSFSSKDLKQKLEELKVVVQQISGADERNIRYEGYVGNYIRELLSVVVCKKNKRMMWKLKRSYDKGLTTPMDVLKAMEDRMKLLGLQFHVKWLFSFEHSRGAGEEVNSLSNFNWWTEYQQTMSERSHADHQEL